MLTLLLFFLTCGIWGLIVQYRIAAEINRRTGGVRTQTLSATCRDARSGKPVKC